MLRDMLRITGEEAPEEIELATLRKIAHERSLERRLRSAHNLGLAEEAACLGQRGGGSSDLVHAFRYARSLTDASAMLAAASVGAIPQLGFNNEASGIAFCLDIADLFQDSFSDMVAFEAVTNARRAEEDIGGHVRRVGAKLMRKKRLVPAMIDTIKKLLEEKPDDGGRDP